MAQWSPASTEGESHEGILEKGLTVMSRGVAGKLAAVLLSMALCSGITGCSLNLPGEWFGERSGPVGDEPENGREAVGAAPEEATVGVSPHAGPGQIREAPLQTREAPVTPQVGGGLQAVGEDYKVILSFSDLGVIEIALDGEGATAGNWQSADAEARKRCRAWGYPDVAGNTPMKRVRLYRCYGKVASTRGGHGGAAPELWRTADFRRVLWNFRSRAEQGDRKALELVQGMAAHRRELERRADQGDAKAWTAWMFSSLMTSGGEMRTETWRCLPREGGSGSHRGVMLGRLSQAGAVAGIGEVSTLGASHPAVFRAVGPALRWEFGNGPWQQLPHAFVIEPDGGGYQFDRSGSGDGQAEPRRAFDCKVVY